MKPGPEDGEHQSQTDNASRQDTLIDPHRSTKNTVPSPDAIHYPHHVPPINPRFTKRKLRTMVDEILKVEPQIFGSKVQHTPIARKMELWQTIVNRVNVVGHHPRTRDDIRRSWNDLRGKVRAMASNHHIAVQKTGGGPPPTPPNYTDWEGKVLAILHPEGLTGLTGGMD
ncbi:hypothetical protein NDU88_003413 [Pleurodeles waltl]|uniref:Myb/SANT-like DNA-binding domain-containing protein n=1 Tax=Pleurodeles waltl TaxID=8319 RepID=A0AAV7NKM6_PLEWA|nr:hypothetical protein NDU88_003413 [Pleurodeles waltl]